MGTTEISFLSRKSHLSKYGKFDSLDVKKATGLDEISPKFLKDAAPIVCTPLEYSFNNSVLKGKIPESCKNTNVTPIFKAGDPTNVSNYRPISVIPVIMKVFERIVYNQLSTYLKVIYYPLYGMNNYVLIWGDWLSCLRGSYDSQSLHIRKHLCPILWQLWFICRKIIHTI